MSHLITASVVNWKRLSLFVIFILISLSHHSIFIQKVGLDPDDHFIRLKTEADEGQFGESCHTCPEPFYTSDTIQYARILTMRSF